MSLISFADACDAGYDNGKLWYKTSNPRTLYILVDSTPGAAVWQSVGISSVLTDGTTITGDGVTTALSANIIGGLSFQGVYDTSTAVNYPTSANTIGGVAVTKGMYWVSSSSAGSVNTNPIVAGEIILALVNGAGPTTDAQWDIVPVGWLNGLQSITDDGNGQVTVDNTDPINPIVEFTGVVTDGTTIGGTGLSGDPIENLLPAGLINPGYNYYYVEATTDALVNGTALLDAYALAAALTPGGNAAAKA